jgi:hypothetical protein
MADLKKIGGYVIIDWSCRRSAVKHFYTQIMEQMSEKSFWGHNHPPTHNPQPLTPIPSPHPPPTPLGPPLTAVNIAWSR